MTGWPRRGGWHEGCIPPRCVPAAWDTAPEGRPRRVRQGLWGSVSGAAALLGIRPSTAKRHLADLRARSGLTTEQLTYAGRAGGWLVVPSLEPGSADQDGAPSAREIWGSDVNTPSITATRRAPRAAVTRPRGVVTRPRTRSPHQMAVHRPTTSSA